VQAEKQPDERSDSDAVEEHIEQDDNEGDVRSVDDEACAVEDVEIILTCTSGVIEHQ